MAYHVNNQNTAPGNESDLNSNSGIAKSVTNIQGATRHRLTFLNDLADIKLDLEEGRDVENGVLDRFYATHEEFLNQYFQKNLQQEFSEADKATPSLNSILRIFDKDLKEVIGKSLEKLGPRYSTHLTDESFTRAYMKAVLKLPKDTDIPDEKMMQFQKEQYVPNAFITNGSIHFNMNHVDFDFEKKREELRKEKADITDDEVLKIVENNRDRAIIHEIGHYCLDRKDRDGARWAQLLEHLTNALRVKELALDPTWTELEEAVDDCFDGKFGKKSYMQYLHEAVAIRTAAQRRPLSNDAKERVVVEKFEALLAAANNDPFVHKIIDEFEQDVSQQIDGNGARESSFHFAQRKMSDASSERKENHAFRQKFEDEECGTYSNKPDAQDAKKKMSEDIDDTSAEMATPDQVLSKIESVRKAILKVKENKSQFLSLVAPEKRDLEEKGLNAILEKFSTDMDDLSSAEEDTLYFQEWEKTGALSDANKNLLAEKYGFSDIGTYTDTMSDSDVMELDEKNKRKRGEVLSDLADLVASHFEPITKIANSLEEAVMKKQEAESKTDGSSDNFSILDWIKKTFGKDGGVHWLSCYDLIKVYNIYKDAIVERYHSKQKIRTYQAAQKWNVWAPLQPDLDKQAKSANDEETEKFKEYLKKDGFTYDQLFQPGGKLDENRGNINRAKAVIDYAADHAWLYKLDRTNGNDVYGVDYQGAFGDRTFEELVENNAAQQDKESKNGYSKVNNYPEIYMIVDDMIEELKKKNLWQVHGMMSRLQEKAKLAESNTWALTTLYRALREDPDVLELIDIGMLDKIGNLGIGQSAWALTLYKVQRKNILAMKKLVEKQPTREAKIIAAKNYSDSDEGFVMGRAIKEIEGRLPTDLMRMDAKGHPDFKLIDHEVAKVLAGQTIKDKDGNPLSIFDSSIDAFSKYRQFYIDITDTTPTEPKKTDPDFFNPGNGGSDLLLLGQNEVGNILGHQSQGPWIEENKAINFVTQIFMRDEDLIKQDESGRLRKNFRAEMKRKLTLYLNSKVLAQPAAMNYLAKVRTSASPSVKEFIDPKTIQNKVVLLELKKRGMIDASVFKKIRDNGLKGGNIDDRTLLAYQKDDPTFKVS